MKKIWFNNPALPEMLADNGIELTCNEGMEIVISDNDVEIIEKLINKFAPAAINDYGIEEL